MRVRSRLTLSGILFLLEMRQYLMRRIITLKNGKRIQLKSPTTAVEYRGNISSSNVTHYSLVNGNWVEIFRSRGSTGRTTASNLHEQQFMNEVKKHPLTVGRRLKLIEMNDPRWSSSEGWQKWQATTESTRYGRITIHFLHNPERGWFDDFKFNHPR